MYCFVVQKDFWPGFEKASGVYAIGEVFEGVELFFFFSEKRNIMMKFKLGSLSYVGDYQKYMTGLLAYPLYYQVAFAFCF